jgi:phage-related minor tail protein
MKYLFGNTGQTGDVGGFFGSLFGNTGSTSSAAAMSSAGWSGEGVGVAGASSSSSGIGSWLKSLFSGKASGGAVTAGTGYLVGENGPEFFSPSMNGTITPNHALGGSSRSGSSVINVTVQPTSTRRTADQVAAAIASKQRIASSRNS